MKYPHLVQHLRGLRQRDESEAEYLLRVLREDGLLGPTKRGFGAADADPKGAAAALLASMLDTPAKDTPRAVRVLMSLKPRRRGGFGQAYFGPIDRAAEAETFGDALALLISGAPTLKAMATDLLMLAIGHTVPVSLIEQSTDLLFRLDLTIQQRPAPHASLVLRAPNDRGIETIEFRAEWIVDGDLLARGFYDPEMRTQGDLQTRATVSHKTIFKIGSLIAAPADDEEEVYEHAYDS